MKIDTSVIMPVIHHLQLCVKDIHETLKILRRYGFVPFAKRETAISKEVAARLSSIVFIVSEKTRGFKTHNKLLGSIRNEDYLVLCSRCENEASTDDDDMHVDTVFNVALNVKNVNSLTDRVKMHDANSVIHPPSVVKDSNGYISFSIIKSICGNVVHTLLNLENYHGYFLPGFTEISNVNSYDSTYSMEVDLVNSNITHVDHVTLACHSGYSESIIKYYENAFGMEKFKISRDEKEDGLILEEGVGLRLRTLEYWLCSETGLVYYPSESHNKERSPQSLMLVVVESLPGQKNCNIEAFLRNHKSPGIEHVAFSSQNINDVVDNIKRMGVKFRSPPDLYYHDKHTIINFPYRNSVDKLMADGFKSGSLKLNKIDMLVNMDEVKRLGILVDREDTNGDDDGNPKILMQIFAEPLFKDKKTFFIEIIQRFGAIGLGSGNVIALLKSIREAERRKAVEENESLSSKEDSTDTRIC